MEGWEIVPAPYPQDPRRHALLIRGGWDDVAKAIAKLGPLCGRPREASNLRGEALGSLRFDYVLPLHDLTVQARAKAESILSALGPRMGRAVRSEREARPAPLPPAPAAPAPKKAAFDFSSVARKPRASETFSTLVPCPGVRMAVALAEEAARHLGERHNPIVFYGPPGSGKTHLLNALALRLHKARPGHGSHGEKAPLLTNGAALALAAYEACRSQSERAFEEALRRHDAILIDDVHLIGGMGPEAGALASRSAAAALGGGALLACASVYPPEAIGPLCSMMGFDSPLARADAVGPPDGAFRVKILQNLFLRDAPGAHPLEIEKALARIAASISGVPFREAAHHMGRLRALFSLSGGSGASPEKLQELWGSIWEDPLYERPAFEPAPEELKASAARAQDPRVAHAPPLALVVPSRLSGLAPWILDLFNEAGKDILKSRRFRLGLVSDYDPESQEKTPLEIAASIRESGARDAFFISPAGEAPEGRARARLSHFSHAIVHSLHGLGIRAARMPLALASRRGLLAARLDLLDPEGGS